MQITKIRLDNILKIKKHRYFNEFVDNYAYLNKILHYNVLKLMLHAMLNRSMETLLIMDTNFNSRVFTSKDPNNVSIPDSIINTMNNNDEVRYIMLHNHPNNSNFSIQDLKTFISRHQIVYLMVITNDCKHISILGMNNDVNFYMRSRMLKYIEEYCRARGVGKHGSAEQLIMYFEKHGLLYAVYRNY